MTHHPHFVPMILPLATKEILGISLTHFALAETSAIARGWLFRFCSRRQHRRQLF